MKNEEFATATRVHKQKNMRNSKEMKRINGMIWMMLSAAFLILHSSLFISCSDDDANVRPGLWTAEDIIETFPGDTVLVQGQVSNFIGLKAVEIRCDEWGISQRYNLDGEHSKVFNYNYQMAVPEDATFDAELKITVTDKEGTENKKTIAITYLPDTEAPVVTVDMPWQVSADFNPETGTGTYQLGIEVTDRSLEKMTVEIPAINYAKTIELKGRSASVSEQIVFSETGTFPMAVTLYDTAGNATVCEQQVVVMPKEVEDAFSDYPIMWVVNASENADDYIDGYYAPMVRKDAYQYEGSFYADKDGYQLYIVPTKTMDGDLFGASPYVSSKLMNKQGYVVPVTIEQKGYYGLWIDLQAHSWSVWSLDTSAAYTGSLTFSGCGFKEFSDWGTPDTEMTRDGFRYTQQVTQDGAYSGTRQYYAARVSDWGWILRYWSSADGCGWWVDDAGYGGSVGSYESDYDGPVLVTFDTAILWGSVKKK